MVFFWVAVLGLSILLYVLLDGSDLGVGILFGATTRADHRDAMMASVAPVWDGNETWLIVAGVILWGAFPSVYAALLSAFYLPIILMLAGLILRGIAFEFRGEARQNRWVWDAGFCGGSLVAAFMQGLMVGTLVAGLPIHDGVYAGGDLIWLRPFSLLCGAGLCLGYTLLGACWLVRKCDGEVQAIAYRVMPAAAIALAIVLVWILLYTLTHNVQVVRRWLERPLLFIFPPVAVGAAMLLARGILGRPHHTRLAGYAITATFMAAFATYAFTFWPYLIPFSVTIIQAAAPRSSLSFMFWGEGLFILPLMFGYSFLNYRVFRGKTATGPGYH